MFALGLLVFGAACSEQGPRRLPFPTFDARAPFPELGSGSSGGSGVSGAAGRKGAASEFERAIAESMRRGDMAAENGSNMVPESVQRQQVALPGGLISSIPLDFDEWQWASSDGVTLISHRRAGAASPDALIYARGFGGLIRNSPSLETRRFLRIVDPALAPSLLPAQISGDNSISESTSDFPSISNTGAAASSVPGLDYESAADSFSGWRWLGRNPGRVEMRMARTSGVWRDSEGGVEPAWMLVGSAVVDAEVGAHIAIVCKTSPRCPVAAELSAFLAELGPGDPATLAALRRTGANIPLSDVAGSR
jgi:hypothetical protein